MLVLEIISGNHLDGDFLLTGFIVFLAHCLRDNKSDLAYLCVGCLQDTVQPSRNPICMKNTVAAKIELMAFPEPKHTPVL